VPAVSVEQLADQLRHLRRRYRVVRASELPDAVSSRRIGQRLPVALTFDDDLLSHVETAGPVLRAAGVPATFFLCGASLDGPSSFWWEDLQQLFDRGRLAADSLPLPADEMERAALGDATALHRLALAIENLPAQERASVAASLRLARDNHSDGLLHADVAALAGDFEIGFHTRGHDPLPVLSDDELAAALKTGRAELEAIAGRRLDLIAYPHGKADGRVAEAIRSAGFSLGFTTYAGLARPETDRQLIPRLVPARSVPAFALQLARAFATR
jgi:peptidoglycan/xylan/chitin deacetylase (PgdA/CDA1 family)